MTTRFQWALLAVVLGAGAAAMPRLRVSSPPARDAITVGPAVGMPGSPPTSADGLRQRIREMEARVAARPDDIGAAVLLSDALLRQARATNDGRPVNRASDVLAQVLKREPAQYDALRMLGAIELSRHRFREALEIGRRARDLRPADAWNYGVIGDALVELGEYDEAFKAFETMVSTRPSADAYARIAYARELSGDLPGALEAMQMAAAATSGHDAEAKAWYTAQTGELLLRLGRRDDANREYLRSASMYPDYPLAIVGQGKVKAARGDAEGALAIFLDQMKRTPTLDLAARIGDLYARRGSRAEAERYFQLAEDLAGPGIAQTEPALAMFLAEHDRKIDDAVTIAEAVATTRHDIFTDDALAWAYFKTGRLDRALAQSERALRTGTSDERIRSHAAAIRAAAAARRTQG